MNSEQQLDQRRSALSMEKRALLRARLQGRGRNHETAETQTIPRLPADAERVLSFAQQRLWFLDQLVPGSPFYTESSALRIKAVLNVQAFERALNEIVRRHEVLRTSFPLIGEQPAVVVSTDFRLAVPVIDISDLPDEERQAKVLSLATADARQTFDLERGPLLRTTLVRLGAADWVFLLSMHHIVCDGWSSTVFSRELSELYFAFMAGKPSPLGELTVQYADFAYWQRKFLSDGVLERQLAYWRTQLEDLPKLELPTDWTRPARFSYLGAGHKFFLPRSLTGELKLLAQREGATLFMTLLSGFYTLLHRYSGQHDLVVGVPVANRNRGELEKLIGFFVNILVMRNDLSANPTHREVLARVRETAVEAYAHQDLPFEKLVEDLHAERDLAHNPLFQVIFQLHENPAGASSGTANSLSLIEVDRATVKFDLRVDFFQDGDELLCAIEYSTDLFTAQRIEHMGQHLRTIYEAMVGDPHQRIGDFSLATQAERSTLLRWSTADQTSPLNTTIHQRFEEQVARTPNAIAVVGPNRTVTYSQLNLLAGSLAETLVKRGLRADELVAIPAENGLGSVAAVLGVLKAGGAYLPINTSYPDERLQYMLRDANARFLVDWHAEADRYRHLGLQTVPFDLEAKPESATPGPSLTTGDSLAYVMYTSGSTGVPKGICVTHRSVVRLVTDPNSFSPGPDQTFLLLAPLTFDASTLEIWAPLLNGGRLVIYPEEHVSPAELGKVISRNRVTTMWLTAGLFHEIVDNQPAVLAGVKQLLAGGDVLSPRHVRMHLENNPGCRVINGYGPTENTTFTCCHVMSDPGAVPDNVPIGRPVTRTHVYVVDQYNQLSPIGIPGELLTGGEGLARCYLNDPVMTAERFVPDPFSEETRRLYRTGDLVKFLPSGELVFLGRMDRQVKVRGFRVELDEIEKALLKHPAVHDAAVLVHDPAGEKKLTAFVVPKPPNSDDMTLPIWEKAEDAFTRNWETLYDDLYAKDLNGNDSTLPLAGWNASDTGKELPVDEMREWVDHTVTRILEENPKRVLEIGCGTGLLAHRLVGRADCYVGTDFSATVIDRLRQDLYHAGFNSPRVELLTKRADDFAGLPPRPFDVIVLNSIVQYFPSLDYLLRVLAGAAELVCEGGRIFIGDVRSLPHLGPFHTDVQLARTDSSLTCAELAQRVENAIDLERELLIDAALFEVLPRRLSRITHVDVQWKRGAADNELTRYRYDVVLHIDKDSKPAGSTKQFDWYDNSLTIASLREILRQHDEDMIVVRRAPNSRISRAVQFWRRLKENNAPQTVSELYASLSSNTANQLPLDEYWKVAEGLGYVAHVSPESDGDLESCLIRYVRPNESACFSTELLEPKEKAWRQYSNHPLKGAVAEQMTPALRQHLQQLLPDYMVPSSFVMLESLPLTRNGKVDRAALLNRTIERPSLSSSYSPAQNSIQQRLVDIWKTVLGTAHVGIEDNFFELGGDSILCIQLISKAKAAGLHLTVKQMFENQTIAKLAAVATDLQAETIDQGDVVGPTLMTPAQAWLFEQNLRDVHHFNQSLLLEVPQALDAKVLERSFRAVLQAHDALRLRARPEGNLWQAFYAETHHEPVLEFTNLANLPPASRRAELERRCANVQASLNVTTGPIWRACLYDLGPTTPRRLLLAFHHLVVDGVSWRILLEDLWTTYNKLATGQEPDLPAKTTSMHRWAERLAKLANSEQLRNELDYWLAVPPSPIKTISVDFAAPEEENIVARVRTVRETLSVEETQAMLTELPKTFRSQVNDILLTAFSRTIARWTGHPETYFDLEGHGREPLFDDVDLSRTVGWFTSIFPVSLKTDPIEDLESSVHSTRNQLEAIPNRGVGFGILKFLSHAEDVRGQLRELPKREISFNYLGQFGSGDGPIRAAAEDVGPMRDPGGKREYLLEIDGSISQNQLTLNWSYSDSCHRAETIQELARTMMTELRSLIEYGRSGQAGKVTPADFPAAGIDQEDLNRLLAKLNELETEQ